MSLAIDTAVNCLASLTIDLGIITFLFSFVGVYIGSKGGGFLEEKSEKIGGVILIGIGVKILIEHTLF